MSSREFEDNLKNMITELKSSEYDKTKKVNLLFGSGINFHITSNPLSWSDLAQDSLFNYFSKTKRHNDFTNRALANEFSRFIGNKKLLLAISKNHIKLNPEVVWNDFTYRFKNDLEILINRFQTFILTLNYDESIEEIINKESINLLEGYSKESSKVNHMHGVISENEVIESKKMLTINDYVENYHDSREIFKKLFIKKEKEVVPEYVFIFGASMEEEHILSAFQSSKINEIVIIYFPDDSNVYDEIKKIYQKMNIQIINYNFQNNPSKQSEDFKKAWSIFSKLLLEKNNSKFFLSEEFFNSEDFINLKKDGELTKNKKFMDLNNDQKIKALIYMKAKGEISANKYLSYYDIFPNIINRNVYLDSSELNEETLIEFMKKIEKKINFERSDTLNREINFIYKILDEKKLNKYFKSSDFHKIAAHRIIKCLGKLHSFTMEMPKELFDNQNLNYELIVNKIWSFTKMPNSSDNKLFNNFFSKNIGKFPQFKTYETPCWKTLETLVIDNKLNSTWKTAILLTKQWSNFIKKKKEKIFATFKNEKYSFKKFNWFLLIYLIFIKTNKKEVMEIASKQNEIREYPTTVYYIGHSDYSYKIDELDGKLISAGDKSIYLNNIDEFLSELQKINKIEDQTKKQMEKYNLLTRIEKININTTKNKMNFIEKVDEIFKDQEIKNKIKFSEFDNNFTYLSNDIDEYIKIRKKLKSTSNAIEIIHLNLEKEIKNDFLAQKNEQLLKNEILLSDAYKLAFLKINIVSHYKAYHIGYDWYKKLRIGSMQLFRVFYNFLGGKWMK